jgi:hypothetical protein
MECSNLDKLSPDTIATTPNVIIYKRWHQTASIFALVSPMLVLALAMPLVSSSFIEVLIFIVPALALTCLAVPLIFVYWVYPPVKDVVRVESDGLVFQRYGVVPFDSITAYTLDGTIRLTRRDQPTLILLGNRKTPGYHDFFKALKSSLTAWRADHAAAAIKQSYFQGTPQAKLIGGFIAIGCLGLAVTIMNMGVGMSALPALVIGFMGGFALIFSKRRD